MCNIYNEKKGKKCEYSLEFIGTFILRDVLLWNKPVSVFLGLDCVLASLPVVLLFLWFSLSCVIFWFNTVFQRNVQVIVCLFVLLWKCWIYVQSWNKSFEEKMEKTGYKSWNYLLNGNLLWIDSVKGMCCGFVLHGGVHVMLLLVQCK